MILCDPYLAGIYGRKFERDGWDVDIAEEVQDGERRAAKSPPAIVMLEIDCVADVVAEVKRLRSLPTLIRTKLVLLAKEADRELIEDAMAVGADSFLLLGHFVPLEAVTKMRALL
jgi:DNA-binding response OmpR family regulator